MAKTTIVVETDERKCKVINSIRGELCLSDDDFQFFCVASKENNNSVQLLLAEANTVSTSENFSEGVIYACLCVGVREFVLCLCYCVSYRAKYMYTNP